MNEEQLKATLFYLKALSDYIGAQFELFSDILPPAYQDQFLQNIDTFNQVTFEAQEILKQVTHE